MSDLVLIKGAGDLATGIAHRLHRCGFRVVMTEIEQPTVIRRTVSFAEAVYVGFNTVEGVTAQFVSDALEAADVLKQGEIPVMTDPDAKIALQLKPGVVVDAIMAKKNTGTRISDAPLVIGLGPGFTAGIDVHAVIETKRGHNLGRVILEGCAEPNTGVPGDIDGYTSERLIKAPADGIFIPRFDIGSLVKAGEVVGFVDDHPVEAAITGVLRGLIRGGIRVTRGQKIGDIDPRSRVEYCFTISDKARAVAGGVLEAILLLGRSRLFDLLPSQIRDGYEVI
ncbi:MAG TPA: EF2563 family selenium-dependent molybdenum hydroxylase system protein [Syntrophomonadaceae bacterium]|nr:EF2563 family selenium-dependent molybdenum hydroxylase system protein [Syntrophomonadaceae bacterium]